MSYSYEIYSHLRSVIQTLGIDQVMTVADVTDRAYRIGWSCSDMYSFVLKGNEDPVLRQFFRALDRETSYEVRDMNIVASNVVERWLKAPPPSPSMKFLSELMGGLTRQEQRDLLYLLTEEECLDPTIRGGIDIVPQFDCGDWSGFLVHVHRTGDRRLLDHNPGRHDDIELLIKMLKQVCK